MATYGTIRKCGNCGKRRKMHTVKLCMRCYAQKRYADPKKAEKHREAMRTWANENKERRAAYMKEYHQREDVKRRRNKLRHAKRKAV